MINLVAIICVVLFFVVVIGGILDPEPKRPEDDL